MDDQIAKAMLGKLDEISLWLRFSCRNALKETVRFTLRDDRDRIIYEMTDGNNSTTEISKKANCSQPTVSNIWNRWKKIGIVVEVSGVAGRCKVLCTLDELGIDISDKKLSAND